METRTEQVQQMPKLGKKDQVVYWLLILLTGGFAFPSVFMAQALQGKIAFLDYQVVAKTVGNADGSFLMIMTWCLVVCWMLLNAYAARVPIFGRNDIEYGLPNYPDIYPLLMRDKPISAEGQMRKTRYKMLAVVVAFLFSATMFVLSLCGRSVMLNDGSIETYDDFNSLIDQCSSDEVSYVRVRTYAPEGKSSTWRVAMVAITQDLEEYRFWADSFRGNDVERLQMMIKMKELYGDRCIIEGVEDIHEVVEDQYSDPQEEKLLHKLFEVDPEVSE